MPESRYKPPGKWVVQALDHKFAPFDDNASPRRWRSFSPQMWANYLGWVRGLQQKALWTSYPDELYDTLAQYMLEEEPPETECPACPDCEECPPPKPPPPTGGSGAAAVGRLGLTIEELEDFIMGWTLRGQIAYVDGKLCYWSDGCCDWVPVPSESGSSETPPPSAQVQAAITAGLLGFGDWEEAGEPTLPEVPSAPHNNPSYTTMDSIRCAKATALVEVLKKFLIALEGSFAAISAGTGITIAFFIQQLGAALVTGGLSLGATALLALGMLLFSLFGTVSVSVMAAQVLEWLADDSMWDDLVCTLSGAVLPSDKIEDEDIKQLLYYYFAAAGTGTEDWAKAVLYSVPMQFFKQSAQLVFSDTECGCEDYLPHSYEPPQVAGFKLSQMRLFGGGSVLDLSPNINNQIFEYIDTLGPYVGQFLSNASLKTSYAGISAGQQITKGNYIIEAVDGNFDIGSLKVDFEVSGTNKNGGVAAFAFNTVTQKWQTITGVVWNVNNPGQVDLVLTSGTTITNVSHIAIETKLNGVTSGPVVYLTIKNVRVTGTVAGVPFVDLPLNTAV